MTTMTLNKAQIEVLDALSVLKTDEEIYALKQAISEFFSKRADAAMEKLWESGSWDKSTIDSFATAHYRTTYK